MVSWEYIVRGDTHRERSREGKGGKRERREKHGKNIFLSYLLQINPMDYYNGEDAPEDKWVWTLEEEKKLSRVIDAILYSLGDRKRLDGRRDHFQRRRRLWLSRTGA